MKKTENIIENKNIEEKSSSFYSAEKEEEVSELTKEEKKEIKKEVKEIISKQKDDKIEPKTKEEKINSLFDKIEFLSFEDEQKWEIALQIKSHSKWDRVYYVAIILSSLIATLWLLQNSVAVVIWAMLIAPLLKPMNAISFSIARWWWKIFKNSLFTIIFSILISIWLSFVITKLIWLNKETSEIFARTTPNIIDFFIAIFSGMVAVMSLRFPKLWEWVAWVAMAASLIPPLSVVGIELSFWNYDASLNAFMLFWANLIAIILVAIIFFWLYGFTPHDARLQSKSFKRLAMVTISVIIIFIPLLFSFNNIKTSNEFSNTIKIEIQNIIKNDLDNFEITKVQVEKKSEENTLVKLNLKVSEWIDLQNIILKIKKYLKEKYKDKVGLEINIIRKIDL